MVDENILRGHDAIEAVGWAEERREELELRQQELKATAPQSDEKMVNKLISIVELLKVAVLLLKILVGFVGLVCVLIVLKK